MTKSGSKWQKVAKEHERAAKTQLSSLFKDRPLERAAAGRRAANCEGAWLRVLRWANGGGRAQTAGGRAARRQACA